MSRWDLRNIEAAMDDLVAAGAPDDPKERRRQRLVAAATALFVKQGYRKTSIAEVAREAGVGKGTIYLYFQTKGELLLHAIVAEKKRNLPRMTAVLGADVPAEERLRKWLHMGLTMAHQMPLAARLLSGDRELLTALDELPETALAQSRASGLDFVSELINAAAGPHRWNEHELKDRARVLTGLMYFTSLLSEEKVRQGLDIERFSTILADLLMDGVKPRGGSA